MKPNKPEVVAWLHEARQDSDVITDKVRYVWGTPRGSMGAYSIPLIRLSDYEALQAELEQWKNGSTIRDEQNEELHQYVLELKTEIEKLRKDAAGLVEALERIAAWPDGGNQSGQPHIKIFAAKTLAAHLKQQLKGENE